MDIVYYEYEIFLKLDLLIILISRILYHILFE